MITLKLTNTAVDEILYALRTSYLDYDERLAACSPFNSAVESHNKELDEIIQTIKDQVKEQEV